MAYPSSLDVLVMNAVTTLPDGTSRSPLSGEPADNQNDVATAVEALQTKVGVNASTDANSLDYKVAALSSAPAVYALGTAYGIGARVTDGTGVWAKLTTAGAGTALPSGTASSAAWAYLGQYAGLTQSVGDGRYQQITEVSSQLVAGAQSAAAASSTVLKAALLAASTGGVKVVAITVPGTYYVASGNAMYPGTSLMLGPGVTLAKPDGDNGVLLVNHGATLSTPQTDSDIRIFGGGTIQGSGNTNANGTGLAGAASGTYQYGIQGDVAMCGVNRLVVEDVFFYNCNGFALQLCGDDCRVTRVRTNTIRDGIHVSGGTHRLLIDSCAIQSGDDAIALNAWDWQASGPVVADIDGVTIRNCSYLGAPTGLSRTTSQSGVKFLAGQRASGYGAGTGSVRNVLVQNFRVSGLYRSNAFFFVGGTYDQLSGGVAGNGGVVENVLVQGGNVTLTNDYCRAINVGVDSGNPTPADNAGLVTLRNVRFDGVEFDVTAGGISRCNSIESAYLLHNVQGLSITNSMFLTDPNTATDFVRIAHKSALDSVTVGMTYGTSVGGNVTPAVRLNPYSGSSATAVKRLTVTAETAPGVTVAQPWLVLNAPVTDFIGRDCNLDGTGGSADDNGISVGAGGAVTYGVLDKCRFNGVKTILSLQNGASGTGGPCRFSVVDTVIAGAVHPAFVSSGRSLSVACQRGSIDTGANVLRVTGAGSSIVASFDGTTTSGTGATVYNVLSSAALEILKNDRATVFPASGSVLTPLDGDTVYFAGTPAYTGVSVVSGTGAGQYVYRGTGTAGWVKVN